MTGFNPHETSRAAQAAMIEVKATVDAYVRSIDATSD